MKKLFVPLRKKIEELPESCSTFPSIATYNFSHLPRLVTIHCADNEYVSTFFQSLPDLPFDLVILHAYGSPDPHQIALLYELRSVVSLEESTVLVFHHDQGNAAKKWRLGLRLTGFPKQESGEKRVSVWGAPNDYQLPRCKTKKSLEGQHSTFYQALLGGTKRLLEVFPQAARASKEALALGIPVTVFTSGRSKKIRSLVKSFGGGG